MSFGKFCNEWIYDNVRGSAKGAAEVRTALFMVVEFINSLMVKYPYSNSFMLKAAIKMLSAYFLSQFPHSCLDTPISGSTDNGSTLNHE